MVIAVPVWDGHVATVFDAAEEMVVIERLPDGASIRKVASLEGQTPLDRTACLKAFGADVVICGALSRSMAHRIEAAGIRLVPFIRGSVDEVIEAFRHGRLDGERFLLPGCRGMSRGNKERRRRNGRKRAGRETEMS